MHRGNSSRCPHLSFTQELSATTVASTCAISTANKDEFASNLKCPLGTMMEVDNDVNNDINNDMLAGMHALFFFVSNITTCYLSILTHVNKYDKDQNEITFTLFLTFKVD